MTDIKSRLTKIESQVSRKKQGITEIIDRFNAYKAEWFKQKDQSLKAFINWRDKRRREELAKPATP